MAIAILEPLEPDAPGRECGLWPVHVLRRGPSIQQRAAPKQRLHLAVFDQRLSLIGGKSIQYVAQAIPAP